MSFYSYVLRISKMNSVRLRSFHRARGSGGVWRSAEFIQLRIIFVSYQVCVNSYFTRYNENKKYTGANIELQKVSSSRVGCRCCCANQYLLANPYIVYMQPYFLICSFAVLFAHLWCRRRAWKLGPRLVHLFCLEV